MKNPTNLLVTLIVIFLVIVGVSYLGTSNTPKQAAPMTATTSVSLTAAFSCEDKTAFTAQFMSDDSLNILINNAIARKLPLSAGTGKVYEDATYKYAFAGEQAYVETKATGKMTNCSQPGTPVNFGDAGEGGGTNENMIAIVSDGIIGKWQSVDDASFTREFRSGAVVVDTYATSSGTRGTWKLFTKKQPLDVSFPIQADAIYLQMQLGDKLNFRINKVTPEELELTYMERGNTLRFKKI